MLSPTQATWVGVRDVCAWACAGDADRAAPSVTTNSENRIDIPGSRTSIRVTRAVLPTTPRLRRGASAAQRDARDDPAVVGSAAVTRATGLARALAAETGVRGAAGGRLVVEQHAVLAAHPDVRRRGAPYAEERGRRPARDILEGRGRHVDNLAAVADGPGFGGTGRPHSEQTAVVPLCDSDHWVPFQWKRP